jgi:hypothetical protein
MRSAFATRPARGKFAVTHQAERSLHYKTDYNTMQPTAVTPIATNILMLSVDIQRRFLAKQLMEPASADCRKRP